MTGLSHRSHAVRVAAVAAGIVMVLYVIGVIALNIIVANRLTNEVDSRLAEHLSHVHPASLFVTPTGGRTNSAKRGVDIDDAPSFLWSVTPAGRVTALTVGGPPLPRRQWSTAPITVDNGPTPFRFLAKKVEGDWVVAGQSVAEIPRVGSAFVGPEVGFGAVLLLAVFVGALIIGTRASAPLEVLRRRQGEFTADASHELRTPLSVIQAEVDLALRADRAPEDYREVLERIGGEGRRLRQIVDDLLWLARSDGSMPERTTRSVCDLAEVAAHCAVRFQAVSEWRGVALTVERIGRGPFMVAASVEDVDRLTGVLVDNACRYAGSGGRVEVRVSALGNRVHLSVDDTGPGIANDEIPFIFDRFHRATESPGGTGLGLAIADAVVRASRGTWVVTGSQLGGAHMEVVWRRPAGRRGVVENGAQPSERPVDAADKTDRDVRLGKDSTVQT